MIILLKISLIILIIVGLLLFILGLQRMSQLMVFGGAMAFLAPLFYFVGWMSFLPFVPPIALAISYIRKKKTTRLEQTP